MRVPAWIATVVGARAAMEMTRAHIALLAAILMPTMFFSEATDMSASQGATASAASASCCWRHNPDRQLGGGNP